MIDPQNLLLSVKDLSCFKGDDPLFQNLSFTLKQGNGIHLTGRNGSGKTTLLRCLAGLNKNFSGYIDLIDNNSVKDIKLNSNILYIGHQNALNDRLTPLENLTWWYSLHNKSNDPFTKFDLIKLLNSLDLKNEIYKPCYQLSAGQKRRVSLVKLYFSEHKLWILDEPFTSLDKESITIFEHKIINHLKKGNLLLMTNHQTLSFNLTNLNIDEYQSKLS